MYTGPKDADVFNILLSSQPYEKVMKNNVDLELSFNPWDISILNILNTSKSAIFASSVFFEWGQSFSKHPKGLSCLVSKKMLAEGIESVLKIPFSVKACMDNPCCNKTCLCHDDKRLPVYKIFYSRDEKV